MEEEEEEDQEEMYNVHERLLCEEEQQPNLISDQCIVQNTQDTGCGNRKNLLLVPS